MAADYMVVVVADHIVEEADHMVAADHTVAGRIVEEEHHIVEEADHKVVDHTAGIEDPELAAHLIARIASVAELPRQGLPLRAP